MRCCNALRLCSSHRLIGYGMNVMSAAILVASYYAVVVLVWGPRILHGGPVSALAFVIVMVFHILLALSVWSYFMAVFSDPGSVPGNWRPMIQDESLEMGNPVTSSDYVAPERNWRDESLEMGNPVTSSDYVAPETRGPANSSSEGLERRPLGYCNHCRNGKPPRCHHCSLCRRCVLKMDHHCLWVGNCLGANNYKFFLLLLLYSFLQTVFVCLVLSHFVIFGDARNSTGSALNINYKLLAFSENLLYAPLFLVFLVKHAILTLSNTTSIEVFLKKKGVVWEYDLGRRKNFEQVFGTKKLLWFFPLYAKEDLESIPALQGLDFPVRLDVET